MRPAVVSASAFPSISARVSRILFVVLVGMLVVMSASLSLSAQNIATTETTLTFAKQPLGSTSAGQLVVITNNGADPQPVAMVVSPQFSETDTCGGNIGAGLSCNLTVFFTPANVGIISGALAINDDSGNLLASIGLKGTGEIHLLAAPASINFGSMAIGSTSVAKSLKITNQNTSAVTISSVAVSGDYIANTAPCLNATLLPTKFCTMMVQAAPTSTTNDGTIIVGESLGGTPLVVPLLTNGTGGGTPPISLSPATLLTFKGAAGGISAAQAVTVTNNSGSPVTMSGITAGSEYSETDDCPTAGNTLAPSGTCTINITFTPQFAGKFTTSVAVAYSGTQSPQLINVTGTAVAGLTAPATVAFGTVKEGVTSLAKAVKILNNTASTVTLGSITLTNDFLIYAKGTTCALSGAVLAPGGSCVVDVQFAPTVAGPVSGALTVNNTVNPGPLVVGLSGSGTSAPFATLSPNSAQQGITNLTVAITGNNTHFDSTTQVSFGTNIIVGLITVNSATSLSVPITIGSTATVGSRTVTMTTGSEVADSTFTVLTGVPSATLNPSSLAQGSPQTTIAITGFDTNFATTSKVNFGADITVGKVVYSSPTSISVPVTVSATAATGPRNVTITTSGKVVTTTFTVLSSGPTYTIGGTISGLTGSGLVLQDNGGNNLSVPSGATTFTFSQAIAGGSTYNVTVLTQPSSPTQTCVVTNGSGTATSNVTSVQIACTTNTYTIGGSISGYTGSGLVLQDNGGNNLTVSSGATSFTFSTPIASGSAYNITVLTQPSSPAQTCTVTSGGGTVTNANITTVQVTCTGVTYTIGGSISGYSGSGLVLQDNGSNNLSVSSGATAFTFSQPIPAGNTYNVTVLTQPSSPTQTCVVTNGSGTANANVTNVQVACTTNTYTIGGTISGYSGSGLVLQDNGGNNLTVTSGATAFTFSTPIASGSTYNVTVLTQPSSPTETCFVTSGSGTVTNANITSVQIACSTQTFTIGGNISGYSGSGLVLQDNGGNNLSVSSGATTFTFSQAIPSGSTYNVTVLTQPSSPAQNCVVTNGSGTANANVTNVQVTCTTITYTIGGSISGYAGSGLVLQDNGGNSLSPSSGATSFTFSQAINAGSTYNVTVLTQPTGPTENCTVTNGSGTANANVTNVQVTCSAITISATLSPSSAHQGSTQAIVITGTGTSFGPTTTVNFGANITAGTVAVNGPTSASVPITIDNLAVTGARNVTITTGAQQVTVSFSVLAGVSTVTLINPNTIQPTQSESVTITGAFTSWGGTTKANFGPGISVGGATPGAFGPVTVNSATSLTANLSTSGATIQSNPVQIQTGGQTLTVNNGISIQTCNTTTPSVLSISPNENAINVPLNAPVQVQFNEPMDRTKFLLGNTGSATIFFYDTTSNQEVPGTISVDASGTIAVIAPSEALPAGRQFIVSLSSANSLQDTCANTLAPQQYMFTTAFSNDLTGPALTGSSPVSGDSNIPVNSPIMLQFSDQLDPITAQTGFSLANGSNVVSGNFSYSPDDKTVTFTPTSFLIPSATYTVSYNAQITDTAGNPLTNPGSFTFTAGAGSNTTAPSVTAVNPPSQTTGVGLNVKPRVSFSTAINGLTIPAAMSLSYANGPIVPATVTVAANRLSATLTPTSALLPNTQYQLKVCGYADIAGNTGNCSSSTFVTGNSAISSHLTVSSISPANAQTLVPLNAQIVAVMSNTIDPTTLTSSSLTVTPSNGSAIAGTLTLASDGVTLTFVPTALLTSNKAYTVSISGFSDAEGNTVTAFTSTFTAGAGNYGPSSFKLSSTVPANKATAIAVNSQATFTMTNLINPASVNPSTVAVEICFDGSACSASESVAGTYVVSGSTITFTPLTPYPGNTVMGLEVNGLLDEAGNACPDSFHYFTTVNTADTTPPTVTVTPANGATNVGLNTQIVLGFSESINTSTITSSSLAVFSGDTAVNYNFTISLDNKTIIVTPGGSAWSSGAAITVALSNAIQDLSGNALANTTSQFTLTTAASGTAPTVVSMRPSNGATNVPANTAITLFTSAPMNASTITGALNVTDNGVVVSGSVQLFSNGQAIEFTPSSPFNPGDVVQVFLGSTAQGANGAALSSFSGQFSLAGSLSTTAQVQAINPFPNATGVPRNTVIQVAYNQPLLSGSVTCNGNSGSVTLFEVSSSTYLTPTCTLVGGGQVINIAPASNLVSGSQYTVNVTNSVTNTSATPVQASSFTFTAGNAVDNAGPNILSEAPTNNATNIGTNALVSVNFNKAINPVSVTGSTIQLSGGSVTEVPSSISFTPDYRRVTVVPQAPLPASTVMTLAVNGVTSQAGVSVITKTTSFTTAAAPDFTAPVVIFSSVQSGQANVPVNSVFSLQFSKPMDIGSYNPANVYVMGGINPLAIAPTTVLWSSDQTTISLVPTSPLNIGDSYSLCSSSMTDLDGNVQVSLCVPFTAAFTINVTGPAVVNTSPEPAQTQVPTNAPVQILFSEPVQPNTIGQITLKTGANPIAVSTSFSDANQLLTLTPAVPLLINTSYTLSISGVKDTAGNSMSGTVTNTFTTGGSFDLAAPSVLLTDPAADALAVGTNVIARVEFSERMNPLSIATSSNEPYNQGSVELLNGDTGVPVAITVTMSSDRGTAILTPTTALLPSTLYELSVGNSGNYYDVAGNSGPAYTSFFTTAASTVASGTHMSSISPANSATAVPINSLVNVVMSGAIDPTSVTSNSITVTPSGGSAIAGTVTLGSDGVSLTFTPASTLAKTTVFNVAGGGFRDVEGNTVTSFSSTFTTNSATYTAASFTVVNTIPANSATNIAVNASVTFQMSNQIDAASVSPLTVQIVCSNSPGTPCANATVAGTYSVSGNSVIFTPLTPYPGGASMEMILNGLMDVAGNVVNGGFVNVGSLNTASTNDTTKPTVAITPSNGATNIGLNPQIVLTFSKSINPTTVGINSIAVFSGDVPLSPSITVSADNRTVVLSGLTFPTSTTITVLANHLITDLSGNTLNDTMSQFSTASAVLTSAPAVVNSRPANGATNVPANTVITLFTSAPMNLGTISGALFVSQNGVAVSGTPTMAENKQSFVFTPNSAFAPGAPIQVFLNSTAQDIYGNSLANFQATFTTAGSASSASVVQAVNPGAGSSNVPLNTTIQVQYNQALQSSTVTCNGNSGSVKLFESSSSTYLTPNCTVSGQVININPTGNLAAGSQYTVTVLASVLNTSSIPVMPFTYTFTAGAAVDNGAPVVTSVAPPDSSTNIGTNAGVSVNFDRAINPLSVTGSTIQLSGGSITAVPSSISFTPDYTRVTILPQSPLPANTQMAIAINGVTSVAGVAVASQTTHFTTMAGPDLTAPFVIHASVATNQFVGTNAAFAMQFNEPIDPGSVNPAGAQDVYLNDTTASAAVPANITVSTDLTTVMLTPTSSLTPGDQMTMCSSAMTNLSGITQQSFCVHFSVGAGPDTTGPSVLQVSPPAGSTGVGTNALIQILFNEQLDGASLAGVTLKQGGSTIPTITTLFDGNQGIQLLPLVPLAANTAYTINVIGVLDITGNAQSSVPSQSFTTGSGLDLILPAVVSTNPTPGSSNVPVTTTVQFVFSKPMDPASFDPNSSFTLQDPSRNRVPATISFSPDYKTVTLTPNSSLTGGGAFYGMFVSSFSPVYDLSGNKCAVTTVFFTTQ